MQFYGWAYAMAVHISINFVVQAMDPLKSYILQVLVAVL